MLILFTDYNNLFVVLLKTSVFRGCKNEKQGYCILGASENLIYAFTGVETKTKAIVQSYFKLCIMMIEYIGAQ